MTLTKHIEADAFAAAIEAADCPGCEGRGWTEETRPRCCGNSDWECGGQGCTGPVPEHAQAQCEDCRATGKRLTAPPVLDEWGKRVQARIAARAMSPTPVAATVAPEGEVALTVAREIIAYIDRRDGAPEVANGVLAGRYDCADDVAFATAKIAATFTASPSTDTVLREAQIAHMTERFLSWKLPSDFRPDAGISFKAEYNEHTARPMKHEPSGTNLFDAQQAEVMVRHMLEGWPS